MKTTQIYRVMSAKSIVLDTFVSEEAAVYAMRSLEAATHVVHANTGVLVAAKMVQTDEYHDVVYGNLTGEQRRVALISNARTEKMWAAMAAQCPTNYMLEYIQMSDGRRIVDGEVVYPSYFWVYEESYWHDDDFNEHHYTVDQGQISGLEIYHQKYIGWCNTGVRLVLGHANLPLDQLAGVIPSGKYVDLEALEAPGFEHLMVGCPEGREFNGVYRVPVEDVQRFMKTSECGTVYSHCGEITMGNVPKLHAMDNEGNPMSWSEGLFDDIPF